MRMDECEALDEEGNECAAAAAATGVMRVDEPEALLVMMRICCHHAGLFRIVGTVFYDQDHRSKWLQ